MKKVGEKWIKYTRERLSLLVKEMKTMKAKVQNSSI